MLEGLGRDLGDSGEVHMDMRERRAEIIRAGDEVDSAEGLQLGLNHLAGCCVVLREKSRYTSQRIATK